MRAPNWYVIQVETGRELVACESIQRAASQYDHRRTLECDSDAGPQPLLRECFAPRYRGRFKLHGEWHDEDRLLLPGYVIAVTDDPWTLARLLRGPHRMARILTMGETFAPLTSENRAWIERWTTEGDRTVPLSYAHKEGDKIVVTSGALVGFEGMIQRIDRRRCLAYIEILAGENPGQITVHTTVGLVVKPEAEGWADAPSVSTD